MKPEEKANKLIEKFRHLARISGGTGDSMPAAKQCALICVEEILNSFSDKSKWFSNATIDEAQPYLNYWNEVKSHLLNK